jgi:hypothetical protein
MFPYLRSELPIVSYADTKFNARMRDLHEYASERTAEGIVYTHLAIDIPYTNPLAPFPNNLLKTQINQGLMNKRHAMRPDAYFPTI